MSKRTAKKPTGPTCTAIAGSFKCVLSGEHPIHSTSPEGRKARQYATWSTVEDGRIRVITYSSGKKMSEWFEDAPPARNEKLAEVGYCGAMFQGYARMEPCTLTAGHAGPHHNTSTDVREVEVDPRPLPSDFPEEDESDPTEDEPDELEMRTLARQQREAREAHAAEVEAATKEPSLTSHCKKCGYELGEHDGKKCPKPVQSSPGGLASTMPAPRPGQPKKVVTLPPQPAPRSISTSSAKLTKIGAHEVHPAAALFPMIGEAEYPTFLEDIRVNGQRKKIVRIKGLILDGRNRLRACLDLGFEPKFREFGDEMGDGTDPIAFVVSENIHRRHLNETQRAFVGAELVPMYEAQAKERMLAGKKDPTLNSGQGRAPTSAEQAAKAVNVGKASVEAAIKVNRDATPEVIAASKDRGQMKVSTAAQLSTLPKQKQREIVKKLGGGELRSGKVRSLVNQEKKRDVVRTINEQRVEPAPLGPFGVIVIDPPWPYENSDQHEGSRGHLDYPSMSIHAICELHSDLERRAKDDCILGMWVTNAFIHEVGRILFAWDFVHRTMITWDKVVAGVGMLPRGQTEHLVIATRGTPVHTLNEVTTMLRVAKREHSRKPDEMYELLAKHCSGPRLDMFSREQREGWSAWGAEPKKFASEAA